MTDTQPDLFEPGSQPGFLLPDSVYYTGGALKAVTYGRIGGYLVIFTGADDRDSYGEYFTSRTDYGLDYYRNQPVLYHHGQNDGMVTPIGVIDTLRMDDSGIYAEAQLDVNHEDPTIRQYARTAYQQVNAGQLYWSSGSAGHLVRTTEDGEIVQWFIVEGSLTPKPAEQRGRTQVEVLRAALRALNEAAPETEHPAIESAGTKEPDAAPLPVTTVRQRGKLMTTKMDSAQMLAALDNVSSLDDATKLAIIRELATLESGEEVMEGEAPAMNADMPEETPPAPPEPPVASRSDKPVDAKALANQIFQQMRTAPAAPLPGGGGQNPAVAARTPANQIQVRSKYHDLSPEDMAFLNDRRRLLAVRNGIMYFPEPAFMKELVSKAQKAVSTGTVKSLDETTTNRLMAIKDNELDNTASANQILEWIPTLWTSELWRRVRVDNNVASSIRSIEMPSKSYELPVEYTDPTVYKVPETTNESQLSLGSGNAIPDSVVQSTKQTLTAVKLGLRVGFSTEAEEDSIIPFIAQLREQGLRSMMNAVDNVIVNGDTETGASTNINDIAGTPAATDKFLVFNGMRKLGLVTNTAVSVNASAAAPTLQMIRQARFKLQSALNVYALYPRDLVMFCDPYTYGAILNIDELNVWMNNGRSATVNTGDVPLIDGVELYPSQELTLANSAGKIDLDTTSNNQYGTIIIAGRNAWTLGYRRQVTTSVDFLPYYDSYQFTATIRLALVAKDTVSAAVIYGIGV